MIPDVSVPQQFQGTIVPLVLTSSPLSKCALKQQPPLKKKKLADRSSHGKSFKIKDFFQEHSTLFENYDQKKYMLAFSGQVFEDKMIISYSDLYNVLKNQIDGITIDFTKIEAFDFTGIVVVNPLIFKPQLNENILLQKDAIWRLERIKAMLRTISLDISTSLKLKL